MAEQGRIYIIRIDRNKHLFYCVLSDEDKQNGHSTLDTHLFTPGEMLELATWIEQNRTQLEQEAQEDEAQDARTGSEDEPELPNWAKKESEKPL